MQLTRSCDKLLVVTKNVIEPTVIQCAPYCYDCMFCELIFVHRKRSFGEIVCLKMII